MIASTNKYNFVRHNYSDTAYYFLTTSPGPGKTIVTAQDILSPADYSSTEYDALYNYEVEAVNLINSGREWYQPISSLSGISINPGFTDIITSEKMNYDIRVVGRASISTLFRLYEGADLLDSILVPNVDMLSSTGTYANIEEQTVSAFPSSSSPTYVMRFYNNGEEDAGGWLDYVRFRGRALTSFSGKTLKFSDATSVQPDRITEFTVKSTLSAVNIWDVSDPFNTENINYTKTGDNFIFHAHTDSLRTFIVFTDDEALIPVINPQPVPNQNLHGSEAADMVIVTHPLFRSYAEKLAKIHSNNSGLISLIVTPEEIYNEFSGGVPDIAAIRNFMRMKYH